MSPPPQPIIHSNRKLLREKLRNIDSNQVIKRIGRETTVVFLIDKQTRDPSVPILSDKFLKSFIKRKRRSQESSKRPQQQQPESSSAKTQQQQQQQPPQPLPQQQQQQQHQQQQQPKQQPKPQPEPETVLDPERRVELEPPRRKVRQSSPTPPPFIQRGVSFAKGTIDELIIREAISDEFAYLDNEDEEEEESVISKNLKKIRTLPQPGTSNGVKPQQPAPRAGPSAPQNSISNLQQQPQQQPQQAPVQAAEHDWTETETRLNQGDLDNTYKDFFQQKNKIRSSDLAKKLLKQLVLKCLIQDETKWFLDALKINLELGDINQSDDEFWQELVLRLQTKLSAVAIYKSKANPEYVRSIYKQGLANISQHFYETGQQLKLPFRAMVFLATPIVLKIDAEAKKENADPPRIQAEPKKETPNPQGRIVTKTERRLPIFQNSTQKFPVFAIKKEIKTEKSKV